MSVLQMVLIALFIYLGAIGSIVGNTIGWYCLGRPLVASFVVGLIMGDVQTAMLVGVPLQIAYLANVTRRCCCMGSFLRHLHRHSHRSRT